MRTSLFKLSCHPRAERSESFARGRGPRCLPRKRFQRNFLFPTYSTVEVDPPGSPSLAALRASRPGMTIGILLSAFANTATAQAAAILPSDPNAVAKVMADAQRHGVVKVGFVDTADSNNAQNAAGADPTRAHLHGRFARHDQRRKPLDLRRQSRAGWAIPTRARRKRSSTRTASLSHPGLMASATQLGHHRSRSRFRDQRLRSRPRLQPLRRGRLHRGCQSERGASPPPPSMCRMRFNPESSLIPVARIAGVTRSLTSPSLGSGLFRGQAAVINLGNGFNLIDKTKAGMVVDLSSGNAQTSRPMLWAQLRETLDDARE